MKKSGAVKLLLSLSFIFLITLQFVSSACSENQRIMRISSESEAHGEIYNGTGNYPIEICYNEIFAGDYTGADPHQCGFSAANKILGLSASINAHAQIPSLTTYPVSVCYGVLACESKTSCTGSEKCVVTLSADTNAHLASCNSPSAYSTKICCKGSGGVGPEPPPENPPESINLYWADTNGSYTDSKNVIVGYTKILLMLSGSQSGQGTQVTFEIYEKDTPPTNPDDLIKILTGTVDARGNANATWIVSQADLDATGEPGNFDKFYFSAVTETSNLLEIKLVSSAGCGYVALCSDYGNQEECEQDICTVSEFSIESKNPSVSCGTVSLNGQGCNVSSSCKCVWKDSACKPKLGENIQENCNGDLNPSAIGSCTYTESASDNCDDGFLTYSWGGAWEWDTSNNLPFNPDGERYLCDEVDSLCHYDPDRKSEKCSDGNETAQCPSRVRVPFFGVTNLIIALAVILLIYLIYSLLRKNKPLRRKTPKKTKQTKRRK